MKEENQLVVKVSHAVYQSDLLNGPLGLLAKGNKAARGIVFMSWKYADDVSM